MGKFTINKLKQEFSSLKECAERSLKSLNAESEFCYKGQRDCHARAIHIIGDWALESPLSNLFGVAQSIAINLDEPIPKTMTYHWLFEGYKERTDRRDKVIQDHTEIVKHFGKPQQLLKQIREIQTQVASTDQELNAVTSELSRSNMSLQLSGLERHNNRYNPIVNPSDLEPFVEFNLWRYITNSEYRSVQNILKQTPQDTLSALLEKRLVCIERKDDLIKNKGELVNNISNKQDIIRIIDKFASDIRPDQDIMSELLSRIFATISFDNVCHISKGLKEYADDFPIDKITNIKGEYDRLALSSPSEAEIQFHKMVISELSTPIKQLDKAIRNGNASRQTEYDLDGLKKRIREQTVTNLDDAERSVDTISNLFAVESKAKQNRENAERRARQNSTDNSSDQSFILTLGLNDFFPNSSSDSNSGGLTGSFKGGGGDFGGAGYTGNWGDSAPSYSPPPSPPPPTYDFGGGGDGGGGGGGGD